MTYIALSLLFAGALAIVCEQGSVPNPIQDCIQPRYIEGCHAYKSENACKECEYRYTLNKQTGLCEMNAELAGECCASRAADGACFKCQTGLYMINGKCEESNILGCL